MLEYSFCCHIFHLLAVLYPSHALYKISVCPLVTFSDGLPRLFVKGHHTTPSFCIIDEHMRVEFKKKFYPQTVEKLVHTDLIIADSQL